MAAMSDFGELSPFGHRGRVPRRRRLLRRRTDRGTARWALLLALAGAVFVALPVLALTFAVSS
jgi:hypothetical protein